MIYKKYSDAWFINLYFKHGSVEEALNKSTELIPISSSTFHRKLNAYGIIPSAGRHTNMHEILKFFQHKSSSPHISIEAIYKKMPLSFKTSLVSLYRIYNSIIKNITQRSATVVIISDPNDPNKIVVANEIFADDQYKKNIGDITVPTGFSRPRESYELSVMRVLQQEFSTKLAINKSLGSYFNLDNIKPFMTFTILDVRINVFNIVCPIELLSLDKCSSYKIRNHKFVKIEEIRSKKNLRIGAQEIISGYQEYLEKNLSIDKISTLNILIRDKVPNLRLALHSQI